MDTRLSKARTTRKPAPANGKKGSTNKADKSNDKVTTQPSFIPPVTSSGENTGTTRGPNNDPVNNAIRAGQSSFSNGSPVFAGGIPLELSMPGLFLADAVRKLVIGNRSKNPKEVEVPKTEVVEPAVPKTEVPKTKVPKVGEAETVTRPRGPAGISEKPVGKPPAKWDLSDYKGTYARELNELDSTVNRKYVVNPETGALTPRGLAPVREPVRELVKPSSKPAAVNKPSGKPANPASAKTGGFSGAAGKAVAALGVYDMVNAITDISWNTIQDALNNATPGDRLNWDRNNIAANAVDLATGFVRDTMENGDLTPGRESRYRQARIDLAQKQKPVMDEISKLADIYERRERDLSSPTYRQALALGGYLKIDKDGKPIPLESYVNSENNKNPMDQHSRQQDLAETPGNDFIGPVPSPAEINQMIRDKKITGNTGAPVRRVPIEMDPNVNLTQNIWDNILAGDVPKALNTAIAPWSAVGNELGKPEVTEEGKIVPTNRSGGSLAWVPADAEDKNSFRGILPFMNDITAKRDKRIKQNTYYDGMNLGGDAVKEMLPGGPQAISPVEANTLNYIERLKRKNKIVPNLPPREGIDDSYNYADDLNPNEGLSSDLTRSISSIAMANSLLKSYSKKKILKKALVSSQYKEPSTTKEPITTIKDPPEHKAQPVTKQSPAGTQMPNYIIPKKGKASETFVSDGIEPYSKETIASATTPRTLEQIRMEPARITVTTGPIVGPKKLPSSSLPSVQELADSLFIGSGAAPKAKLVSGKAPARQSITDGSEARKIITWSHQPEFLYVSGAPRTTTHPDAFNGKEDMATDREALTGTAYPIAIDSNGSPLLGDHVHVGHSADTPAVIPHGFFSKTADGQLERLPDGASWYELPKSTLLYKKGAGKQEVLDPQSGDPVTHLRYLGAVTRKETRARSHADFAEFPGELIDPANFRVPITLNQVWSETFWPGTGNVFPVPLSGARPIWVEQSIDDIIARHIRKFGIDKAPDLSIEDVEKQTLKTSVDSFDSFRAGGLGAGRRLSSPEIAQFEAANNWPKNIQAPIYGANQQGSLLSQFDFTPRRWGEIPKSRREDQDYLRAVYESMDDKEKAAVRAATILSTGGSWTERKPGNSRSVGGKVRMETTADAAKRGQLVAKNDSLDIERPLITTINGIAVTLTGRDARIQRQYDFVQDPKLNSPQENKSAIEAFVREKLGLKETEAIPDLSPDQELKLMVYEASLKKDKLPEAVWEEIKKHIDANQSRFIEWKTAARIPYEGDYSIDPRDSRGVRQQYDDQGNIVTDFSLSRIDEDPLAFPNTFVPQSSTQRSWDSLDDYEKEAFNDYSIITVNGQTFKRDRRNKPQGQPLSEAEITQLKEEYARDIEQNMEAASAAAVGQSGSSTKTNIGANQGEIKAISKEDREKYGGNGERIYQMINNLVRNNPAASVSKIYSSVKTDKKREILNAQNTAAKALNINIGITPESIQTGYMTFSPSGYPNGRDSFSSSDVDFLKKYSDLPHDQYLKDKIGKLTDFWESKISDKANYPSADRESPLDESHLNASDIDTITRLKQDIIDELKSLTLNNNARSDITELRESIKTVFGNNDDDFLEKSAFEYARKMAFQRLHAESIINIQDQVSDIFARDQIDSPISDSKIIASKIGTGILALTDNPADRTGVNEYLTLVAMKKLQNSNTDFNSLPTPLPAAAPAQLDAKTIQTDSLGGNNTDISKMFSTYLQPKALPYLKTIMTLVNSKINQDNYGSTTLMPENFTATNEPQKLLDMLYQSNETNVLQLETVLRDIANELRASGGKGTIKRADIAGNPASRTQSEKPYLIPLMPGLSNLQTADFIDPDTNALIIPLIHEHFKNETSISDPEQRIKGTPPLWSDGAGQVTGNGWTEREKPASTIVPKSWPWKNIWANDYNKVLQTFIDSLVRTDKPVQIPEWLASTPQQVADIISKTNVAPAVEQPQSLLGEDDD